MKLAYIATEKGCMDRTTGAYQHIQSGIEQLRRHTELVVIVPDKPTDTPPPNQKKEKKPQSTCIRKTMIFGALKDLRDFSQNAITAWRVVRRVRNSQCEAAYVRMHFPDPVVPMLRLSGIQVFLEVNGIHHLGRKSRSRSALSVFYRAFEKHIYQSASHVFFVGSQGLYWGLQKKAWTNVENGVERSLLKPRPAPAGTGKPLRLVLMARLVEHHKGHILSDAIAQLDPQKHTSVELHLVGSGFESLISDVSKHINTTDHGFVPRDQLGSLMRGMDVGIITGGPPYSSQMKLLDYAASGCLVVAPDLPHMKNFYLDKGVVLFSDGSSASLADKLEQVIDEAHSISGLALKLENHVRDKFTWEDIFERKVNVMRECLRKKPLVPKRLSE